MRGAQARFFMSPLLMMATLIFALPGFAQSQGVSITTLSIARDGPSSGQASVVGHVARQGFERNPRYAVVDSEMVLNGGRANPAAARVQSATAKLKNGITAYDAYDYPAAVESLSEAIVLFEQAAAGLSDVEPLVEALTFQGAAYALLDRRKDAGETFMKALSLNPNLALASSRFPEPAPTLFAKAQDKLKKRPTGSISVYSTPAGAAVWVDGLFRGSAPIALDGLPMGRHYVRVARDGYVTFGASVEVRPGEESTVQASLQPTAQSAKFEDLTSRIATGSEPALGQMATLFRSDRVFITVVQAAGSDVTVFAYLMDGISGNVVKQANKSFVSSSSMYRSELENWLGNTFRQDSVGMPGGGGQQGGGGGGGDVSYLPPPPGEQPTPGAVIAGWIFTVGTVVPLGVGIGFGVAALNARNDYRLLPQDQLDPIVDEIHDAFLLRAIVADVGYVLATASAVTGITLLIIGYNQKQEIEDVLTDGSGPLPAPTRYAGFGEVME
jgi:hypothetical protein